MARAKPPYERIVVKLGTGLVTGGRDRLNPEVMPGIVAQVASLRKEGRELAIVSSGAITAGRCKLGLSKKTRGIPYKQVLAAVGQSCLMQFYDQLFSQHGLIVAQALLTRSDLSGRAGYLNARNTLLALLELGVIPVINENDVVAVDEIKEAKFGDNDNLSAMVANLVDADLLLILSDIGGLYTADPHLDPEARLIPVVEKIDSGIERLASGTTTGYAIGGMVTKIEAARLATASGVSVVIASGREPDVIRRVAGGEAVGTRFPPSASRLESRERWMLSGLGTRGKLVVDEGAVAALEEGRGSLLAAGVKEVGGDFEQGDVVNIYDASGLRLGCGLANYSSRDIEVIKGAHSGKIASLLGHDYGSEVIHRNNLVLL